MLDWVENCHDENIRLYKFEDFFKDEESQTLHLKEAVAFLGFDCGEDKVEETSKLLSFKRLSEGRDRGKEDRGHHYRTGVAETYKTELPAKALDYFYSQYPNYVERLGYVK